VQFMGVGWQEIALVLVVALVVVGPERLPNVAYQVGKAVRTMQQYARAVRSEFSEELGYIEEQYKTVKGEMTSASLALREEQQKFANEMRNVTSEVQAQVASVSNVVNIHDGSPVMPAQSVYTPPVVQVAPPAPQAAAPEPPPARVPLVF
jgi:sec-independent protein translocase protein TatB